MPKVITVFYGDDRVKISQEIKKILGDGYEIFEGEMMVANDLPSLFLGTSLFAEKRKILVKDLSENKDKTILEKIADYAETEHTIVFWETKVDKRTVAYKKIKKAGVKFVEMNVLEVRDTREVLNIFDVALKNGERAVRMLEMVEADQDPFMFFGLLTTQAIKRFEWKQGSQEKRVLKELSKVDMQMKTTTLEPWLILKSFLLRVSSL